MTPGEFTSGVGKLAGKRICVVYDCLFPYTIGGAERWYRALIEGLAAAGAEVTYLTRRQWLEGDEPDIEGVTVVPVSRYEPLYVEDGTRRTLEPLRFGWGVFSWLVRHRHDFDVVHIGNFPYFPIPGARLALARTNTAVSVDWFEVWPLRFWLEYTGLVGGAMGYLVQAVCIRLTPFAFTFWEFTDLRLRAHGRRGRGMVLAGLLPTEARKVEPNLEPTTPPTALFAGRHIKDKGVRHLAGALRQAREQLPELRLVIAGEGPETPLITQQVRHLGLLGAVDIVGKITDEELAQRISDAACVIVASVREGYGMMVVESAAHGTPCVVAGHPENAATGHIVDEVNGFVVDPTDDGLAGGILRAVAEGRSLRESTASWYAVNSSSMGIDVSIGEVVKIYAQSGRSAAKVRSDPL